VNIGPVKANYVAKWNGSAWSALGSGMSGTVSALGLSGTDLYAGGYFTTAGGVTVNRVAKWNGSAWSALGSGVGGLDYPVVSALAVAGTDLYAGGWFTTAGGVTVNGIAKWDGSAWSALGSGMSGGYNGTYVEVLAVSGTDLYAGGEFYTAGGVPATNIAKWNGSAWSVLGSGVDGWVEALAVRGTDLYAAGGFTTAGGVPANYIGKWDGSAWLPLGSGMGGPWPWVTALAVGGTDLYAGGYFTTAGGVAATRVAKWDGSAWSPLGEGIGKLPEYYQERVYALAVSGTDLYAGGWFAGAGGVWANCIARWDGSAWSALGSGMGGVEYPSVSALAVSGTNLYVGGYFTTAGGVPAYCIAQWDGGAWSAMGSGMDGNVWDLAADDAGHLFVGGSFYYAGTNVSPYIAQANIGPFEPNHPPVSDASATKPVVISADGTNATVVLDGTRSSDPDGDLLEYLWFSTLNSQPSTLLASGAVAVVVLPVGTHSLLLVVSDGLLAATNALTLEVITTVEAVERLATAVEAQVPRARPLLASLEAAIASIARNNTVSAINQLLAFQNKVRAQVMRRDAALAASLIQAAQEIIDALSSGATNPGGRPHGRFTSVTRHSNGRVQMQMSAEPGRLCIVEVSTNLMHWEPLGLAVDHGNGSFSFEDPAAVRRPNRFYRLVSP
jgi:hypothetical protein